MKIFNWIVGSFCRTFGRFLFYILLGGLMFFLISQSKVDAATYTTDSNITATFDNTAYNRANMESGKTYYHGDKISSSKGFISKTEITGSNRDDDFDFLLPGAYLLDFYVFGDGTITNNLSCDNINSNFGYKDPETGSYVYTSSAISSKCIEVYNSKYNTLNAVKVLMQINFRGTKDGDYAKYLDLQITNNAYFINKTNYFGVFIGNISDYEQSIVELFHQNALADMQLNQSQQIIDENKQNTDNIINSQNQNTTDIMDNQNSNTDKVLDSNKETQDKLDENKEAINDMKDSINSNLDDKFNSCRESKNKFNLNWFETRTTNGITATIEKNYILLNGTANGNAYINFVVPSGTFNGSKTWFYKSDISNVTLLLQASRTGQTVINMNITNSLNKTTFDSTNVASGYLKISDGVTLNNAKIYIAVTDENLSTLDIENETYGEICTNKLDDTNQQLGDLNSNITNTDNPDLGALENSAGWLPAGPVDSILNLPLSLLNNLTTNLSKRCQPVILPIPYVNKDLTLPCVNTLYDDMGISAWVTTIGVVASAFIMFSYLLKLYRWVDDTLSFRENNQIDNWGGI